MSKKQLASGWGVGGDGPVHAIRAVGHLENLRLGRWLLCQRRRWKRLWNSKFLPPFSLKANFCHKTLSAHPPMFGWCSHEDPSCFLGLGISEGTCTSSSSLSLKSQRGSSSPRCQRREQDEIPSQGEGAGGLLSRKTIPK